jgi:hypothetical protein
MLQIGVPPKRPGDSISLGELRYYMADMAKKAKLGKAFDIVESSGATLVVAASFQRKNEFTRLWYWSNRERMVLVTLATDATPDPETLRDCERMVGQMYFEGD